MTIGERIKILRRKNDMTQEKLAEYLSVSPQAVSKWECGLACPDLALILPLTRLLHVTADELLGIETEKAEKERAVYEAAWQRYCKYGIHPNDYVLARTALMEYPEDYRFMEWLAGAEYSLAIAENRDSNGSVEFLNEMIENALRRYETVIENCSVYELLCRAAAGKVTALCFCGRVEEAEWSAEFEYPDPHIDTVSQILALSSAGQELAALLAEESVLSDRKLTAAPLVN